MKRTERVTKIGILAAIYGVSSFVAIPFPGIPLTFQCFAIALGAYCFGVRAGVSATAVYLALGAVGLPVFSSFTGGVQVLAGPTGGFIWGFLFIALFCGLGGGLKKTTALLSGLLGLFLCYTMGVVWYSYFAGIGLWSAFITGGAPYIMKDVLLTVGAYFLSLAVKKALDTDKKLH